MHVTATLFLSTITAASYSGGGGSYPGYQHPSVGASQQQPGQPGNYGQPQWGYPQPGMYPQPAGAPYGQIPGSKVEESKISKGLSSVKSIFSKVSDATKEAVSKVKSKLADEDAVDNCALNLTVTTSIPGSNVTFTKTTYYKTQQEYNEAYWTHVRDGNLPQPQYQQPQQPVNAYQYGNYNQQYQPAAHQGHQGAPPPPPAPPQPAKSDWTTQVDPSTGRQYFYNRVTGVSSWERPADLPAFPS